MIEAFETLAVLAVQTVALHVFYRAMERRLFPDRPPVDLTHLTAGQRRRKFVFASRLATVGHMLAWPVLAAGWLALFEWAAYRNVPRGPGVAYVFVPVFGMAILVAFAAGFVLCGPAGAGLVRLCLGARGYREAMACGEPRSRVHIHLFKYVVFVWVIPLCIDWEILHANCYTLLTPDAIVIKEFLAPRPVARPYRDVAAIEGVKVYLGNPAEIFSEPDFRITFRDGTTWVPIRWMNWSGGFLKDRDAVEYVAGRSGQPIRWVAKME